jgi:hypothetical protein
LANFIFGRKYGAQSAAYSADTINCGHSKKPDLTIPFGGFPSKITDFGPGISISFSPEYILNE